MNWTSPILLTCKLYLIWSIKWYACRLLQGIMNNPFFFLLSPNHRWGWGQKQCCSAPHVVILHKFKAGINPVKSEWFIAEVLMQGGGLGRIRTIGHYQPVILYNPLLLLCWGSNVKSPEAECNIDLHLIDQKHHSGEVSSTCPHHCLLFPNASLIPVPVKDEHW